MKKLFFFRSSSSSNGNSKDLPPPSSQEETYWENPTESGRNPSKGLFSKSRKQVADILNSDNGPALRRSRSMSSAAFLGVEPGQFDSSSPKSQCRSPSSTRSGGGSHKQCDPSFRSDTLERAKRFEVPSSQHLYGVGRPGSGCSSRTHQDSSGSSSSTCSSNISGKVLDRFIDGEQQQEKIRSGYCSQGNFAGNNGGFRRPPRVQYTSPSSPADSVKQAHLVREGKKSSRLRMSSRDWAEGGVGNDSPRRLAKNVVERLSQSRVLRQASQNELDLEMPVTLEDIYGGGERNYSLEEPFETIDKCNGDDYPYYCENFGSKKCEDDEMDLDLKRRSKEAEERVMVLSEELEQESFFRDCGFDVPSLIQTIRNMAEERVSLALEVSSRLHSQINERTSAKEELGLAKTELRSQTRRLEKEKCELQSVLEKELDRRSSEWLSKLDKYQSEEQRLRERVRELAEQNVSLQREVSVLNERDLETRKKANYLDEQHGVLSKTVEDLNGENKDLKKHLSELHESYRASEDQRVCLQNNFGVKENECKELHKSITRLLRTCSEQDKTIAGLQEAFGEEPVKNQSSDSEKSDKHVVKFQTEILRLTGVEMALRRDLESFRVEVDSLRHENINLLNRLKGDGKESDALTVRLDKEMWVRVCCLQNQGLSMLNETSQLGSKLLMFIKEKLGQFSEAMHGLDGNFVVESEMKLQGLRRGVENLTRSLQKVSALLLDKSNLSALLNQSKSSDGNDSGIQTPEGAVRYELKAETLLTSLLREKLCSKEQEVEQLRAELATAVRSADILQCELQNVMDNLSFVTHKLKDLELQMVKKDESRNRLQNELQESNKELAVIKGILPKISSERDLMWEEVKQYSEKNMLLNSEIVTLKKKIEALDEDSLLKDGQITILKDTLGSQRFDLLASPDSLRDFRI